MTQNKSKEYTKLEMPEWLRLKNGKNYRIQDLLAQRTRSVNHNLRRPGELKIKVPLALQGKTSHKSVKYTVEDRIWLALATVAEIQQRYTINERQAFYMKYQSRYIVEQLDLLDK